MQNIITVGEEYVPVEQMAYIEPLEPPANGQFKSDKPWKGRVVLLNRESVLTEDTPHDFAEANEFRFLPEDNVATNPMISSASGALSRPTTSTQASPTRPSSSGVTRKVTPAASCCSQNPKR